MAAVELSFDVVFEWWSGPHVFLETERLLDGFHEGEDVFGGLGHLSSAGKKKLCSNVKAAVDATLWGTIF